MQPISNGLAALLTLLLAFSITGCSSPDPDSKTPANDTGGEKADIAPKPSFPDPAKMVFDGPGKLLPVEAGDWKISQAPRYFGPDNLYDLINGGAEIYVEFGLNKMVTAEYRSGKLAETSVTAEVYDMGSPLGAFGRTARFLEGRLDPSNAGEGLAEKMAGRGIFGAGDLVVWKDRYIVHLTLMDERADATAESIGATGKKVLPPLAEAVLGKIEQNPPPPAVFDKFPGEDRLKRSEAWAPTDLLGVKGLGQGFTVRYSQGDMSWTAFATPPLRDDASKAAWDAVKGAESEGRRVAIKSAGKRLVGLAQDGEQKLGDDKITELVTALTKNFGGE